MLISGISGSGKTSRLLNLIKHQQTDVDKISLYIKDPSQSKYQLLINEREKVKIKYEKKIFRHSLIIHKQLMILMNNQKTII